MDERGSIEGRTGIHDQLRIYLREGSRTHGSYAAVPRLTMISSIYCLLATYAACFWYPFIPCMLNMTGILNDIIWSYNYKYDIRASVLCQQIFMIFDIRWKFDECLFHIREPLQWLNCRHLQCWSGYRTVLHPAICLGMATCLTVASIAKEVPQCKHKENHYPLHERNWFGLTIQM